MAPPRAKTSAGSRELRGVDLSVTDPVERVNQFLAFARSDEYDGFDHDLLATHLQLQSASPKGTVTFRFKVPAAYCNRMGNLHGGAAALIFDICTTCALVPISKPGYWQFAGVSAGLSVTYLRPAPLGSEVEVFCEVINAGKRLATLRGEIRANGKVLMIAEHMKASIDPPLEPESKL
ncbi:thioesterase family protein [Pyronema omphalodes]|nr:thioesterase family protein [Pyronema omphalodes]